MKNVVSVVAVAADENVTCGISGDRLRHRVEPGGVLERVHSGPRSSRARALADKPLSRACVVVCRGKPRHIQIAEGVGNEPVGYRPAIRRWLKIIDRYPGTG